MKANAVEKIDLDACAIPTAEQVRQMEEGLGAMMSPRRALEVGMLTAIANVRRAIAVKRG